MEDEKTQIIKTIEKNKIIAILRKIPAKDFEETVQALYKGGIRMMEVTFDPSGEMPEEETLRQIRFIAEHYKDVMPGAGTVLTVTQVEKACDAGAKYIISPNTNESVIKATLERGLVSMPGAFTPTEAVNANLWGADFVKLFPIGKMGSGYVKDVAAPLSHIKFLAVGGIDDANIREYLDAGCVGAGVGSSLVNKKLISAGEFEKLEELAARYVVAVK